MEEKPNCKCEDSKENIRPEQSYTLVLHDSSGKEINIKVTESRLVSVICILSKSFYIEIG